MPFDGHKNLLVSAIVAPPSPPSSGLTVVVTSGDGARFAAVAPCNLTISTSVATTALGVLASTSEIVRLAGPSSVSGDTLTLQRAQEGTSARTILTGDLISLDVTAKVLTDIESGVTTNAAAIATETSRAMGVEASFASAFEVKGNWNASTNTPTLADATGRTGDLYRVTVAGTQNLGSGSQTFAVGDEVWLDAGLVWRRSVGTATVVSAADGTITVGGTAGAPTIGVNAIPEAKVTGLTADLAAKASLGLPAAMAIALGGGI